MILKKRLAVCAGVRLVAALAVVGAPSWTVGSAAPRQGLKLEIVPRPNTPGIRRLSVDGRNGPASERPAATSQGGAASQACDPAFAALFTPRRPQLGRYEVCTDPRPLSEIAPADWTVEALEPADAFGGAGSYDHAAVARLYGGRRARVARGWSETADRFEAVTLISPYPNATVTTLETGTLVIRWICDYNGAECKMLNAGR
jgi:hypothetical protein